MSELAVFKTPSELVEVVWDLFLGERGSFRGADLSRVVRRLRDVCRADLAGLIWFDAEGHHTVTYSVTRPIKPPYNSLEQWLGNMLKEERDQIHRFASKERCETRTDFLSFATKRHIGDREITLTEYALVLPLEIPHIRPPLDYLGCLLLLFEEPDSDLGFGRCFQASFLRRLLHLWIENQEILQRVLGPSTSGGGEARTDKSPEEGWEDISRLCKVFCLPAHAFRRLFADATKRLAALPIETLEEKCKLVFDALFSLAPDWQPDRQRTDGKFDPFMRGGRTDEFMHAVFYWAYWRGLNLEKDCDLETFIGVCLERNEKPFKYLRENVEQLGRLLFREFAEAVQKP